MAAVTGWRRASAWRRVCCALLLPLAALLLATRAGAQQSGGLRIEDRLGFIEQRLDDGQLHAQLWQYGWTGVNALGLTLNTAIAASVDNDAARAAPIVDAVKSVIGLADLWLRPLPGLHGFDPIRELPGDTPSDLEARLAAAERLLQADADRALERTSLLAHAANLAVNLAGGGIILAADRTGDAVTSTALGFVVGELQILSAPWRPTRNLADYENQFGGLARVVDSAELRPRANGVEVAFRF